MAEYELYCFAQSGNAYKAALMLNLACAKWRPRFVDFFKGETRTPEYRRDINVMGEVPVLIHGANSLTQSGAILTYLTERLGRFGPGGEAERYEILRWLLWDNHKFTSYIATRRFLLAFMKTGDTPVTEFLGQRVKASLGMLESHLEGREFVLGPQPTIADLSLCGYLYYPEKFGLERAENPRIAAWLDRLAALPGWKHPYDLMPGHPLPA
jgi:glutathione S-transferase